MKFEVRREFACAVPDGASTRRLMRLFGIDRRMLEERREVHTCRVELEPGQICLITGPSGSGKSVLLNAMLAACPPDQRLLLEEVSLSESRPLIECLGGDFDASLRMLCQAGLGDVFTLLKCPARLSEGQQYRFRLAKAFLSGKRYIFADEFCSTLDRTAARITAFQLRRTASTGGQCFILASVHDDLLEDLRPDVVIHKRMPEAVVLRRAG